jgi:hypothetical protein
MSPTARDPLASWNDGAAKRAILDFVARVSMAGGADFVPPRERVAVFDNDGTLWGEMPVPVQLLFADDRLKALAPGLDEAPRYGWVLADIKRDWKAVYPA